MSLLLAATMGHAEPPRPCLMVYKGEIKPPGKAEKLVSGERELKRFFDDCTGLVLAKGRAVAIVRVASSNDGDGEGFMRVPLLPGQPIRSFPANDGSRDWGAIATVMDALFAPHEVNAAARGGDDGLQALKEMLSGDIVVPADGLRIPLRAGDLAYVDAIVVETRSIPHTPVSGVAVSDHVLVIPAGALAAGKGYQWSVTASLPGGRSTARDTFYVRPLDADTGRRTARHGADADADADTALSDAAFFLDHELAANANIVLAEWASREQLSR